ncbi:hypothetical protein AURDEDRAFT_109865 [Auricularia subglabra TFB-10046 SS5]|nr:hypothetical protein AURDEDRAFT_109865 [Auricularia subglabra TFB-10046 SS5]
MMWSSKLVLAAATLSSLLLSVSGHAIIAADQGTLDGLRRGDVTRGNLQRCSNFAGAGTATIQNGAVNLVAKNFNGGRDGSTQFTAALSTTGRNGNFQEVDVTANGVAAPNGNIESPITVAIPAGTDCSGGSCVLTFRSAGGFGNCVDVAANAVAGGNAGAGAGAGAGANTGAGADAGTATTTSAATTATGRRRKGNGRGRNRNGTAAAGAAAAAAGRNRNAANRASRAAALKAQLAASGRPHARSFRIPGETDEKAH